MKQNAIGSNNGNSWKDAYKTIQAGIDDADISDEEVWVAKGTYNEAIIMKSGVKLYGGFNGNETSRSQRDFKINITIINGSTTGGGSPAYHAVKIDAIVNSIIDGFTITGGNANGGTESDRTGGGIYCSNLNNTNIIANNTISGNSASNSGGGICCRDNSSPNISGNNISGNSAQYGSGISCNNSSPTIANNIIIGNSATQGGGIHCCDNSSPNISGNKISGNSAQYGGGIFCINSLPNISGNVINGNSAPNGGGIHCLTSSPNITGNIILGNASTYAGGIYCDSSSPIITQNVIIENSSTLTGGGIYCFSSSPTIAKNLLSGNYSNIDAGAIYCVSSSPIIKKNKIAGNSATYAGGIYCFSSSTLSIMNNIIAGNVATYTGGILCYDSSPTIVNNTIAGNYVISKGGGVCCQENSDPQIKNNIFFYNNRYDIYEFDTNSDPIVRYNDFFGNFDGVYLDEGTIPYTNVAKMDSIILQCSNNIDLNPIFVSSTLSWVIWTANAVYDPETFQTTLTNSSAGWTPNQHAGRLLNPDIDQNKQFVIVSNTSTTMNVWGNLTSIAHLGDRYLIYDYHLQTISPCIDAGCLISGLTEDFEGDHRPINGTIQVRGDGSDYDIGADEYNRSVEVDNWILYE